MPLLNLHRRKKQRTVTAGCHTPRRQTSSMRKRIRKCIHDKAPGKRRDSQCKLLCSCKFAGPREAIWHRVYVAVCSRTALGLLMQRLKCALEARRPCKGRAEELLLLRVLLRRVGIEGATRCGNVFLRIVLRHAQSEVNAHIGVA